VYFGKISPYTLSKKIHLCQSGNSGLSPFSRNGPCFSGSKGAFPKPQFIKDRKNPGCFEGIRPEGSAGFPRKGLFLLFKSKELSNDDIFLLIVTVFIGVLYYFL
jgi:hypothetical protein